MELQRQEHKDIHQQMKLSQDKLREHFESIKGAAETLKSYFVNVQQKEDETERLRQKYYDMLANKSYNEADRDAYFQLEQVARDEKDMYVQKSQKLAFKCTTYVVYSYQHSEQREKFMTTMLNDVDNYYKDCENMKKERSKLIADRDTLQRELHECMDKLLKCEKDLNEMEEENSHLRQSCDQYESRQQELLEDKSSLQETKARLDSTVTDISKKNDDLTSDLTNSMNKAANLNKELNGCRDDITIMNKDLNRRKILQNKADEKISSQIANIESLQRHSEDLSKRNKQLNQDVLEIKTELAKIKAQRDKYQESTRRATNERNSMKDAYDKMRRDKDQMEEQYGFMRHEREVVGKEKDRLVSREYRIKRRNQELTDDHKTLSKLVDDLREKYRRADERARKDGSLKQELRDTIKRLHKEIEEEKRKHNKPVRHAGIQTDPRLACDSRDIAIQHAQFKMKQALKARDQYAVDRNHMKETHDRALKALDKKTYELGTIESKLKANQTACLQMEDKIQRTEKLLAATKKELEKAKSKQLEIKQTEKAESEKKVVVVEEVQLRPESKEMSSQTDENTQVDAKEAEITLNLALCLQKKVESSKTELAQRLNELDITRLKITRLENIIEQQNAQNDILKRKIIYMEGKFEKDRNYMRSVQNVLSTQALQNQNLKEMAIA